jgi:hypothetical protein
MPKFLLRVYKLNENTIYYINVTGIYNNRYELSLTDNALDASVLSQEQVYELVSDFRSKNKDLSYFKQDATHITEMHPISLQDMDSMLFGVAQ